MRVLIKELAVSVTLTIAFAITVSGLYPLVVFAAAQAFFPEKANGSILYHKGAAVGSQVLAQQFESPQYFHPRPSAGGYDATASGGSNLGPTSLELIEKVRERITEYRRENNLPDDVKVPADAATASASGLDPHISVENAMLQAPRVAQARGLNVGIIQEEVRRHSEGRTFGILGEPRVNVLQINIELDRVASGK